MGEYIYLSKNGGTEVNIDGWTRLKELCPNVVIDALTDSILDAEIFIGGQYQTGNTFSGVYGAFGKNGVGNLERLDDQNERYCAYLTNFQRVGDTTSEHYNDIYLYLNDYGKIDSRFGISIDGSLRNNISNLKQVRVEDVWFQPYEVSETESNSEHAQSVIDFTGGSAHYNLNIVSHEYNTNNFTFKCNIPLFLRSEDAQNYINTGDTTNVINSAETPDTGEDIPKQYYFEETIYKYDYAFNNKTYIKKVSYYYTGDANDFRMCGYVDSSLNTPYNVSFIVTGRGETHNYYFSNNKRYVGERRPIVSGVPEKGLRGKVSDDNWIYYAVPHTNIPFASSRNQALQYVNHVIDDVDAPKIPASDLTYKNTGDDTGDQTTAQINKNFAEPLLSSQYICNANQMQAIANVIFTENETSAEALKKGLELYGENPVNDIIDVYHVPFDVSGFISKSGNSKIKFGSYLSDAEGQRITAHGNIVNVGGVSISPIYNDFRDYDGTVNIDLYLPFLGIIPLDINCYMGRTLSIKATADTRSHNLRYYLFSNDVLMSFHDTAFGKPITLMGNDIASKFRQNMSANINMSNANEQLRLSNFGNALSVVSSLTTGDALHTLSSGVSGVINAESGRANIETQRELNNLELNHTKSGRTFSGSQACGCSENDILYPYIIFRVQSTKEPANLLHSYGKPCNIVDKIGTVSGYAQMDSVHLETDAPQHIKQRILNELSTGVIIK